MYDRATLGDVHLLIRGLADRQMDTLDNLAAHAAWVSTFHAKKAPKPRDFFDRKRATQQLEDHQKSDPQTTREILKAQFPRTL